MSPSIYGLSLTYLLVSFVNTTIGWASVYDIIFILQRSIDMISSPPLTRIIAGYLK